MTIALQSSSFYDSESGRVKCNLSSSSAAGYPNLVNVYQGANCLSIPINSQLINIEIQSLSQQQATGFDNFIIDENYSLSSGEDTRYSQNWYSSVRTSGVEIQEAQSPNKENLMMGQSTNKVLSDIMELLIEVIQYLNTHIHSGGTISGNTGTPTTSAPDDGSIGTDKTYIDGNHNLAITGIYEPK